MTRWHEKEITEFYDALCVLREARHYLMDKCKTLSKEIGVHERTWSSWELYPSKAMSRTTPSQKEYVIKYVKKAQAEFAKNEALLQSKKPTETNL